VGEEVAELARLPWDPSPKRPTPKWVEEGSEWHSAFPDNGDFFNSFRVGRVLYRVPRVARSSQPWGNVGNLCMAC